MGESSHLCRGRSPGGDSGCAEEACGRKPRQSRDRRRQLYGVACPLRLPAREIRERWNRLDLCASGCIHAECWLPQRSRHGTWQPFGRKSSWSSAANNANVRRQTPTCARRSWATQTRFLDSSMEMNPSISLIAYSEEDARYRSHWVKSPFMKGITALRSATLKALRLCSIFSASCLNCSLSKMPPNAGFSTNQKSKRDRD